MLKSVFIRNMFLVAMIFTLSYSLTYSGADEETKYLNFNYIHFYYTYAEKKEEMTEAQLEEWVAGQKQNYCQEDTLLVSEGIVYDVKKEGDLYQAEISHIEGSFAEPHLYLKNLSKELALKLKKENKIKFVGQPTDFSLKKRKELNIELDKVEIVRY